MAKVTINNLSNSGIDVEQIISKLIEVKTIPINDLKETNNIISKKIKLMQDFLSQLKQFQDLTKSLYDYRSPFEEKKGISSNEAILKAIASRNADIGQKNIKVIQIAKSERLSSDLLSSTQKIDKISFTITSGDITKKVIFNGGSITDFVNEIKKQAREIVNISIINKDKDNIYITIESKNEGIKNKLVFSEEAYQLLEKLGFYTKATKSEDIFGLDDFSLVKDPLSIVSNNSLILSKSSNVAIDFNNKLKNYDNIIISFDIKKEETKPQQGASVYAEEAIVEGISVNEISVESDPLFKDKPAEPKITGPLQIKIIGSSGEKIITIDNPQKGFKIDKSNLNIGDITKIEILNTSSDKYNIENFKVEGLKTKEGYVGKNILQDAQNSIIEVDGIRLEKSTNKIDDVIKGVTLELKKASEEEVQINIENNYDFIKEKIIEWVGKYNNIIQFIKDEMNTDKGEDGKPKGNFTGDITLMMLHNSLQRTMASFYPTEGKINLLSQLGISTGKPGSNPQEKGGFLEIDEERLDKALKENINDVKKFFGYDSDNDLLPDSGLGVRIFNIMNGMTNFGNGAIRQRINYFTKTYEGNQKRIETLSSKLEDYRDMLIYKFSTMEQMISSLKSQGQYLSNYFNAVQNNSKQ